MPLPHACIGRYTCGRFFQSGTREYVIPALHVKQNTWFAGSMLPIVAGLALSVLLSGANAQSLSQAITNMSSATITYMGYNETGFMNTSVVRRF